MSGSKNSVKNLMREYFPNAHHIHCYAHQLNLVIKKMCHSVPQVRLFFANITGFSSYFSISPKRSDVLRLICEKKLPRAVETRWNFQSRVVQSVFEIRNNLIDTFDHIMQDGNFDDISIREANGLKKLLQQYKFVYWINFFNILLHHTDILYNTFQNISTTAVSASNSVTVFLKAVQDVRNKTESFFDPVLTSRTSRTDKENLPVIAKEVCDLTSINITDRFEKADHTSLILYNMI